MDLKHVHRNKYRLTLQRFSLGWLGFGTWLGDNLLVYFESS